MKAHEIALKAADLVRGERQEQYGPVLENFTRVATLWNAYWQTRRIPDHPFTAEDVGLMLALLKIARTQHSPTEDSYTDAAGYICLSGQVATES
jgi:hypothetical protein